MRWKKMFMQCLSLLKEKKITPKIFSTIFQDPERKKNHDPIANEQDPKKQEQNPQNENGMLWFQKTTLTI